MHSQANLGYWVPVCQGSASPYLFRMDSLSPALVDCSQITPSMQPHELPIREVKGINLYGRVCAVGYSQNDSCLVTISHTPQEPKQVCVFDAKALRYPQELIPSAQFQIKLLNRTIPSRANQAPQLLAMPYQEKFIFFLPDSGYVGILDVKEQSSTPFSLSKTIILDAKMVGSYHLALVIKKLLDKKAGVLSSEEKLEALIAQEKADRFTEIHLYDTRQPDFLAHPPGYIYKIPGIQGLHVLEGGELWAIDTDGATKIYANFPHNVLMCQLRPDMTLRTLGNVEFDSHVAPATLGQHLFFWDYNGLQSVDMRTHIKMPIANPSSLNSIFGTTNGICARVNMPSGVSSLQIFPSTAKPLKPADDFMAEQVPVHIPPGILRLITEYYGVFSYSGPVRQPQPLIVCDGMVNRIQEAIDKIPTEDRVLYNRLASELYQLKRFMFEKTDQSYSDFIRENCPELNKLLSDDERSLGTFLKKYRQTPLQDILGNLKKDIKALDNAVVIKPTLTR